MLPYQIILFRYHEATLASCFTRMPTRVTLVDDFRNELASIEADLSFRPGLSSGASTKVPESL